MRLSLAGRVTLLTTVAVGLATALTSVAAYLTVRVELHRSLDESLLERARAAASTELVNTATLRGIPAAALGAADVRIAVVSPDGRVFSSGSAQPPLPLGQPELAVARGQAAHSLRTLPADGHYRVVAVPTEGPSALVLAQSLAPIESTLRQLRVVLLLVGLAGVVAAAVAGSVVARSGLRPVRRLTAAAEEVARTEELRPIEVRGHDEVARLAGAFNAMLAALAASRARQRRLVADAGHELRTPLTSLRTNLDLAAQADQQGGMDPGERSQLLVDARAQVDELSTLVGDVVELAREESTRTRTEVVDFAEITERAVERVRRRAPAVTFQVDSSPWYVDGDPQLLERAVANLLDNAAKWSPPAAAVRVRLAGGELAVVDEGPGIADIDLPHVFERFYRSGEARGLPGSGLGLAIVAEAAERHGGWVSADRLPAGGTMLRMGLPGTPTPAPPR